MLDPRDEAANAIFEFIEEALEATESVLVHSVRGQSRATCALAAYIMRKYKWSLLKSLEFLNSRRPDLEIRATFINQLSAYEARLSNQMRLNVTSKWDELSNKKPTFACDELLLRNTFINSQMGPIQPLPPNDESRPRAIKWIDNDQEATQGPALVTNHEGIDLRDKETVEPVTNHREKKAGKATIKNFNLDLGDLTGLTNFAEISKNPLALPQHAIQIAQAEQAKLPTQVSEPPRQPQQ